MVQVEARSDAKPQRPESALRREHFMYVSSVSLAVWAALGLALACVFPHYNAVIYDELDKFYFRCFFNGSLLWYLSGGIFFGMLIGLVLNRLVLVAHAKRESKIVPLSRISRIGKFLSHGGGLPVWALLTALYALLVLLQPFIFRATPLGFVPGLSPLQSNAVKMWTADYFAKHPDEGAVPALARVLKNDSDRIVRYRALRALEKNGSARAVDGIISALRGDTNFWVRLHAAKALGRIADPASIRALEHAAAKDVNVQVNDMAAAILKWINAGGKWPEGD